MKNTPLEESLSQTCDVVAKACTTYTRQYEEQIRRSPIACVLSAVAIGYFLQFLPLRRLGLGLIRVAASLIQPALLLFGLLKLLSSITQEAETPLVSEEKKPRSKKH